MEDKKKKKKISLLQAVAAELVILLAIGVAFYWAEYRITRKAAVNKLTERSASIFEAYSAVSREMDNVTNLYKDSVLSKADSLALYADLTPGVTEADLQAMEEMLDVDRIYLRNTWQESDDSDVVSYASRMSDGRYVVIECDADRYRTLLDELVSGSNIFDIQDGNDVYAVFDTSTGDILNSSYGSAYEDGYRQNLSDIGISLNNIEYGRVKRMNINGAGYYVFSRSDVDTDWAVLSAVSGSELFRDSMRALGLLWVITALIMTVIVVYSYFYRQEEKIRKDDQDRIFRERYVKRVIVYAVVFLLVVSAAAYHVQSLHVLASHSIESEKDKQQVLSGLEKAEYGRETVESYYKREYLSEARIISRILSDRPQLRTQEGLRSLSGIFGLDHIMLFDLQGKETVSDSGIFGLEIPSDPNSQYGIFDPLKHGVSYVIQPPQKDALTGKELMTVGVPTTGSGGRYDGILLISVDPAEMQEVLDYMSFKNILYRAVSGCEDEILAVEKDSKTVTYYSGQGLMYGQSAYEIGLKEDQISGNYFSYINVLYTRLFADSFEANGNYVYIVADSDQLFTGRAFITVFAAVLSALGIAAYLIYFRNKDVDDPVTAGEDVYVDVESPSGGIKKTLAILTRYLRPNIRYGDRSPEEKTDLVIKNMLMLIGLTFLVVFMLRGRLYGDDTILGFITSGRWNKGLNVFSATYVVIFFCLYVLIVTFAGKLLDLLISVSNPRRETLLRLIRSFLKYISAITVIYYCLDVLGFDSRTLLASAGLLTLIIGFGSKDLVTDIISGIFIIFENEFQVGDIIEVGGFKGRVLEIGLRTTRIVNTVQDVKSINNRDLTNILNKTRRNTYCDVIVNVPFDQDIDAVEAMLREELPKLGESTPFIINGPTYGGIDDMSTRAMKLSIRTECLEEDKFRVRALVNRRIKELFQEYGFSLY